MHISNVFNAAQDLLPILEGQVKTLGQQFAHPAFSIRAEEDSVEIGGSVNVGEVRHKFVEITYHLNGTAQVAVAMLPTDCSRIHEEGAQYAELLAIATFWANLWYRRVVSG